MVACGSIHVFHVGGGAETAEGQKGSLSRWEYFIGDKPHVDGLDDKGRRQPMVQIREASEHALPSQAAVSLEVATCLEKTDELTACDEYTYLLCTPTTATKVNLPLPPPIFSPLLLGRREAPIQTKDLSSIVQQQTNP